MKTHHYNIAPECFADTVLVELLGFKRPHHVFNASVSTVLKRVQKNHPTQKVVGIIDSDRGKREKLLDDFEISDELHGIKKFVREKHTVLVLCPAFEFWVFENADQVGVNPANHHFRDKEHFKKECKNSKASKNQHLQQFFNTLNQKGALGFVQLKTWICEGAGIDPDDI